MKAWWKLVRTAVKVSLFSKVWGRRILSDLESWLHCFSVLDGWGQWESWKKPFRQGARRSASDRWQGRLDHHRPPVRQPARCHIKSAHPPSMLSHASSGRHCPTLQVSEVLRAKRLTAKTATVCLPVYGNLSISISISIILQYIQRRTFTEFNGSWTEPLFSVLTWRLLLNTYLHHLPTASAKHHIPRDQLKCRRGQEAAPHWFRKPHGGSSWLQGSTCFNHFQPMPPSSKTSRRGENSASVLSVLQKKMSFSPKRNYWSSSQKWLNFPPGKSGVFLMTPCNLQWILSWKLALFFPSLTSPCASATCDLSSPKGFLWSLANASHQLWIHLAVDFGRKTTWYARFWQPPHCIHPACVNQNRLISSSFFWYKRSL